MTTPYPGNTNWPAGWQPCRIFGRWVGLDGTPLAGGKVVVSAPIPRIRVPGDDTVVLARDLFVTLDTNGRLDMQIPASDDPDTVPNGWQYIFTDPDGNTFAFSAPVGGNVDLSEQTSYADPVPPYSPSQLESFRQDERAYGQTAYVPIGLFPTKLDKIAASGTPTGFVLTVQPDGSIIPANVTGGNGAAVGAQEVGGGAASGRSWWKGTPAAIRASTAVPAAGDLVSISDGREFIADGVLTLQQRLARIETPYESGYVEIWNDENGNAAWTRDFDGNVRIPPLVLEPGSVGVAALGSDVSVPQPWPYESGYIDHVAGSNGYLVMGTDLDGNLVAPGLASTTTPVTPTPTPNDEDQTHDYATTSGNAPNRQVIVEQEPPYVGAARVVVSDPAVDSYDPAPAPRGRGVLYSTPAGRRFAEFPYVTGRNYPAVSLPSVELMGDSLIKWHDIPQLGWADILPNVPINQQGVASCASTDSSMRAGTNIASFLIPGGSIPADNVEHALTFVSTTAGTKSNNNGAKQAWRGYLNGIMVDVFNFKDTPGWSFRRVPTSENPGGSSGPSVAVDPTKPVPLLGVFELWRNNDPHFPCGLARMSNTLVLEFGRNNVPKGTLPDALIDLANVVEGARAYLRRYVIMSVYNGLYERRGSPTWALITAENASRKRLYGDAFWDDRYDLINNATAIAAELNINLTSQDAQDIADDCIPTSFHAGSTFDGGDGIPMDQGGTLDDLHLGDAVARWKGQQLAKWMSTTGIPRMNLTAKGWF